MSSTAGSATELLAELLRASESLLVRLPEADAATIGELEGRRERILARLLPMLPPHRELPPDARARLQPMIEEYRILHGLLERRAATARAELAEAIGRARRMRRRLERFVGPRPTGIRLDHRA